MVDRGETARKVGLAAAGARSWPRYWPARALNLEGIIAPLLKYPKNHLCLSNTDSASAILFYAVRVY